MFNLNATPEKQASSLISLCRLLSMNGRRSLAPLTHLRYPPDMGAYKEATRGSWDPGNSAFPRSPLLAGILYLRLYRLLSKSGGEETEALRRFLPAVEESVLTDIQTAVGHLMGWAVLPAKPWGLPLVGLTDDQPMPGSLLDSLATLPVDIPIVNVVRTLALARTLPPKLRATSVPHLTSLLITGESGARGAARHLLRRYLYPPTPSLPEGEPEAPTEGDPLPQARGRRIPKWTQTDPDGAHPAGGVDASPAARIPIRPRPVELPHDPAILTGYDPDYVLRVLWERGDRAALLRAIVGLGRPVLEQYADVHPEQVMSTCKHRWGEQLRIWALSMTDAGTGKQAAPLLPPWARKGETLPGSRRLTAMLDDFRAYLVESCKLKETTANNMRWIVSKVIALLPTGDTMPTDADLAKVWPQARREMPSVGLAATWGRFVNYGDLYGLDLPSAPEAAKVAWSAPDAVLADVLLLFGRRADSYRGIRMIRRAHVADGVLPIGYDTWGMFRDVKPLDRRLQGAVDRILEWGTGSPEDPFLPLAPGSKKGVSTAVCYRAITSYLRREHRKARVPVEAR